MQKCDIRLAIIGFTILVLTACYPGGQAQPYQQDFTTSYDHARHNEIQQYDATQNGRIGNVPIQEDGDSNQALPLEGENIKQRNLDPAGQRARGAGNLGAPEVPNDRATVQEIADRLVTIATRVDQVNRATAVVVGRYAVVGIDVDAHLDRSKIGSIKYSVAEALKADPHGAYAIVSADADTYYRLQRMGKEIQEGRPLVGVMEELAEIVGRLMPQVPRHVVDPQEGPQKAGDSPVE